MLEFLIGIVSEGGMCGLDLCFVPLFFLFDWELFIFLSVMLSVSVCFLFIRYL